MIATARMKADFRWNLNLGYPAVRLVLLAVWLTFNLIVLSVCVFCI